MKNLLFVFGIFFSLVSAVYAKEKIVVFHAGSLSIPFNDMEKVFEKQYPEVDIVRESSGSRTAARKISDLNRSCDVIASADYTVIEQLLIPQFADWNISFAANEMAIMYTEHSKYKDLINKNNWPEILLRTDVNYGHSDPNADPCGYRSLLVWQLAEKFYAKPDLYNKLIKGCPKKNIRPKETDLIALLEAGELDYLFIYKSVAAQHNMPYIELPEKISLKTTKHNDFYKQASIKISGKKPGDFVTKEGQCMVYGLTIPKNAPNLKWAIKFVDFILSYQGRNIMTENGQEVIAPAQSGQADKVLQNLKKYL